MSDEEASRYAAKILAAFRETDCDVSPLPEDNLEFTHPWLPAKTHVYITPYFLQFSTFAFARPKAFSARFRWTRDRFLNEANQHTNLMKLTCAETRLEQAWSLLGQAKITSGSIAHDFGAEALDHLVKLWLQDLAYVIKIEGGYEVTAMIKSSPS